MALDIRLDFISNIDPEVVDEMTALRSQFIMLDQKLQKITDDMNGDSAGLRAIALARTNLEISLQYAIKSLCIQGENHGC
ncbi:MAG: hypothetical protein [Bacteriophage sp.]|nr:MAG: hypothetical protein [Bacteriophage sp.]